MYLTCTFCMEIMQIRQGPRNFHVLCTNSVLSEWSRRSTNRKPPVVSLLCEKLQGGFQRLACPLTKITKRIAYCRRSTYNLVKEVIIASTAYLGFFILFLAKDAGEIVSPRDVLTELP